MRTNDVLRILHRAAALTAFAWTIGCGSMIDGFSGRKEACAIIAVGQSASGRILRLVDTGTSINDNPVVEFVLEVTPQDGIAYQARTKGLVSRLDVPAFQPGRVVPLKVDPQDPARVAMDLWDCPKK
jgi:hypothetical protein